MIKDTNITSMW